MSEHQPSDPVDALQRWVDAGGEWRVTGRDGDLVTVGLFTCDGGEMMSWLACDAEALRSVTAGEAVEPGERGDAQRP